MKFIVVPAKGNNSASINVDAVEAVITEGSLTMICLRSGQRVYTEWSQTYVIDLIESTEAPEPPPDTSWMDPALADPPSGFCLDRKTFETGPRICARHFHPVGTAHFDKLQVMNGVEEPAPESYQWFD